MIMISADYGGGLGRSAMKPAGSTTGLPRFSVIQSARTTEVDLFWRNQRALAGDLVKRGKVTTTEVALESFGSTPACVSERQHPSMLPQDGV